MANMFRQRLIKPGRDLNYSEGQKVLANAAIKADQIVYIMGSDGPFSKVDVADADAAGRANGRLLIAKHDIPAGGYGVCLPWKLVTTKDTSGAGVAVGDAVYLSATPGTTVASNLTLTAPAAGVNVVVGRVTVAATVALGGAIMIQAASPESRVEGGTVAPGAGVSPVEALTFVVEFGNTTVNTTFTTAPFPIILTDAYIACGNGQAVGLIVKDNAGAACLTCVNTAASTAAVSRATAYAFAAADIAAGQTITMTRGGTPHASDVAVITAIRA